MDEQSIREGIRQAIRNGTPPDKIASAIKNGRLSVIGMEDTQAYKARDVQLRDGLSKTNREITVARQEVDEHESSALSKLGTGISGNVLRGAGELASAVPGALKSADKALYKGAGHAYQAIGSVLPGGGEYDAQGTDADLERKYKDLSERPLEAASQVVNRAVNSASLGAYNAALDPISELTGLPFVPSRPSRDRFVQEHPVMSSAADAIGGAAGAPRVIGTKIAGATPKPGADLSAMQRLAGRGAGGKIAADGLTGAAAGGLTAGTMAAMDGADLQDTAGAMLAGGVTGGAIGAGASALGSAAGGIKEKLRGKPRSISRTYQEARESGAYDPLDDGSPNPLAVNNEQEVHDLANAGRKEITSALESRRANASRDYGNAQKRTLEVEPDLDADKILEPLQRLANANGGSRGQSIDPEVDKAIGEAYRVLAPDENGKISTADLLAAKRVFQGRSGDPSRPPTAEERPWRILQKEFGEVLPSGMQDANKQFSGEMSQMERINDVLSSLDDASISGRASKERAMTRAITRAGESTKPAWEVRGQLDEIAGLDPTVAKVLLDQEKAGAHFMTRPKVSLDKSMGSKLNMIGDNLRAVNRGLDAGARTAEGVANATARFAPYSLPADLMGDDLRAALKERERRKARR